MACRKYYDGLCVGGSCEGCKQNDPFKNEPGNGWLGVALIILGLATGVVMGFVLA